MQVRLQDIADKLGVHVTTVSKALLGNPTVAAATRKRVADTAEAMGYVGGSAFASVGRLSNGKAGAGLSRQFSVDT